MEQHDEYLIKAKKNLQIADHMAYVTYNVVQEPRILLSMLENIFLSFAYAMGSLLYYERLYKRIPLFEDKFDSKLKVFKDRVARRYNIKMDYIDIISETKELLMAHKKSPVEFNRKGKLVICSENYRMRSITIGDIKKYLAKAKLFIQEIGGIIERR